MRIAVTGVGTATGEALVRDVRRCLPATWILGLDINPAAPGLYLCDAQDALPHVSAPTYLEALEAMARRWRLDVVLPGLDLELETLADARPRLAALGCTIVVASRAAIELCHDKLACAEAMRAEGLAFVETLPLATWKQDPSRIPLPVIIKPRKGSGSKGVRLVTTLEEACALDAPDLVVQPYLIPAAWDLAQGDMPHPSLMLLPDGNLDQAHEIGVQGVLGADGTLAGQYATQNHLVRGFPVRHTPIDQAPVHQVSKDMFDFLGRKGLQGTCNLQGRLTVDGFQVYEINPRFSAGTAARAGMGFEEVLACIRLLHQGVPAAHVANLLQGREDLICLKVAQEVFVDRKRLEPAW